MGHEVLAAMLQIRDGSLDVLLWQRAQEPDLGLWALPGGSLGAEEDVQESVSRQLAAKVDLREVAHVEQLGVFSAPHRVPGQRLIATTFLGLVPSDADPAIPGDTRWHPVATLPRTAFDHSDIIHDARDRLRAKLSYTNLGFALAPAEFTLSALRDLYVGALGHPVSATNLQRVLARRGVLVPTGATAPPGPSGGRPAALFRYAERRLRVTDAFAVLRPPSGQPDSTQPAISATPS